MRERATHLRTIGGTVTGPAPAGTARAPARELEATGLEVIGDLPPLAGIYLRNGPNDHLPAALDDPLLPAAAMVHAVLLGGGRAGYRSRHLPTPGGGPVAGAPAAGIVVHARCILAVGDLGPPVWLDTDLTVLGREDPGGALTEGTGPRPRRDPVWDELCTLRSGLEPPFATVTVIDATGRHRRSTPVGIDHPALIGDLGITDAHIVCFDHPVRVAADPDHASLRRRWCPEDGTRVGVLDREGDPAGTRWFEVETREVVAVVNAWREGARIVVDQLSRPAPPWAAGEGGTGTATRRLVRTTIDLAAGRAHDELLTTAPWGRPVIDERRTGLRYRYLFAATGVDGTRTGDEGVGVVTFDLAERSRREYRFPEGVTVGEPQFVPATPDAPEGEGWLLACAHDAATDRSELVVLDAADPAGGPRARVVLPQPLPPGRHGTWAAAGPSR